MLRKLVTAVKNVFAASPRPGTQVTSPKADAEAGHAHSFSCPCANCCAHTNRLTLARLRETPPR